MKIERLKELALKHVQCEAEGDMEGVLSTMVPEPVFEFVIAGCRIRGMEQVRAFYKHFFANFLPNSRPQPFNNLWFGTAGACTEHLMEIVLDGKSQYHYAMGIFTPDDEYDKLGGERVYAGEYCARLMMGDELFEQGSAQWTPLPP